MKLWSDSPGERLDLFLVRMQTELTRSHVQKLIENGRVLVDGKLRKANFKLHGMEEVELSLPEPEPVEIMPEELPLDILYEDSDIIVINKARGMTVHPAAGISRGTLVNGLLFH